MILFHLLYVLICFGARVSVGNVPSWPTAYHAKGTINIPYDEISEPFEAWYYKELGSSRVDYYNGTSKTYQLSKVGKYGTYFKLEPVLTVMKCFKTEGTKTDNVQPQSVLPDMTDFLYGGTEFINGVKAEKWERTLSESVLTMYVYWKDEGNTKVIQPLRFKQEGLDHYYMDFEKFENFPPSPEVFVIKNVDKCIPLYDLAPFNIENQLIHKFNPIKEFIDCDIDHINEAWQSYKKQFKKQYDKNEDVKRRNIFRQSLRSIMSVNRANLSYSLGINHMTDYTAEEIKALACVTDDGHFGDREQFEMSESEFDNGALPSSWDWRYRGAVTPVKDQATCGSCWAFMSTGAIEGYNFLNTKLRVPLSEQALIDCAWNYGGKACEGAPIVSGFKWVIANKGIPSTMSYGPYMAMDDYCHVNKSRPSAEINHFKYIKRNCATCLKRALINFGPVAVGVHVNHKFRKYKYGIFVDHECPKKMNHAVLIVGYGKLDGEEYWLVKNSWGHKWGVDGYMLVAIKGNTCGIMNQPVTINP